MPSDLQSLIDEVSEDLRRDRALALARKYGPYAIALALIVIIGVASWVGWQRYRTSRNLDLSTTYASALAEVDNGSKDKAQALLGDVVKRSPSSGYGTLARLQQAALKAKAGDAKGAAAIYDTISKDTSVDPAFRSLGTILYAFTVLDTADPAQLAQRLKPLADG